MKNMVRKLKVLITVYLILGLVGCGGECSYVDDCKIL